jgi:hypothetical protein
MTDYANIKDILDDLRIHFYNRLNRKTGWGKEELKLEFEKAISDTMIQAWDRKEAKP